MIPAAVVIHHFPSHRTMIFAWIVFLLSVATLVLNILAKTGGGLGG